jgi:hypothetical protein
MSTVVHPWVSTLPWKQQSILLSGMRGPDAPNVPNIKAVNRWMRIISQHNADPSKNYMKQTDELPGWGGVCDELEFLPVHYVHHFADALAVIAYGHPDHDQAEHAAVYHYYIAEELFHFRPETRPTFEMRHRDKPNSDDSLSVVWIADRADALDDFIDVALGRFA